MLGTRPGRALRRRRSNADPLAPRLQAPRATDAHLWRTCASFASILLPPHPTPERPSRPGLLSVLLGWYPSPHCVNMVSRARILHVAHYANYHRVVKFALFFPTRSPLYSPAPPAQGQSRPAPGRHTGRGRPARGLSRLGDVETPPIFSRGTPCGLWRTVESGERELRLREMIKRSIQYACTVRGHRSTDKNTVHT